MTLTEAAKWIHRTTATIAVAILVAVPHYAYPAIPVISINPNQPAPTLAPIVKKVGASVVSIAVRVQTKPSNDPLESDLLRPLFGLPALPSESQIVPAGSGVVIDGPLGLIVTNNHVIEDAEQIFVTLLDGREVLGVLQGADPDTDVALIKIPIMDLPTITHGDSSLLEVGDYVLAIGNPFGIGQTVTSGIVSGLRRNDMGLERYEDFIQTDAAINPGNSGGALVNLHGELVGINSAIVGTPRGNAGIGFAIPINMVRAITGQLRKHGNVERGETGFSVSRLTPELANRYRLRPSQTGAIVTRVENDSPAQRAGIKLGDCIISLHGSLIKDASDLRNGLALMRIGDVAELTVLRDSKTVRVQVAIASPQKMSLEGGLVSPLFEGATFENSQTDNGEKVVEVSTIRSGSKAWTSGLREGDLVTFLNRKRVANTEVFEAMAASSPHQFVLDAIRNGLSVTITFKESTGSP